MNIFRFLNVGQGLFYSGRIDYSYHYHCCCEPINLSHNHNHYRFHRHDDSFRFVYDCGSISKNHEMYLNRAIKSDFSKDEIIDLLFLSHFHEDHINGFNLLKNHCKEIKNIILPYLFGNEIILLTYLAINTTYDLDNSIEFAYFYQTFETFSKYSSQDTLNLEGGEIKSRRKKHFFDYDINKYDKKNDFEYLETLFEVNGWVFYLINKARNKNVINQIKKAIMKLVGSEEIEDIEEFIKYKNNLDKIKKIYQTYLGQDMNLSSIVLLHHRKDCLDEVTMLTGDANFDDQMIELCEKYLRENEVAHLQLPHHGSYKNFKAMKQLKDKSVNLYVSYGLGNPYRHPDSKTVNEILQSGKPIFSSYESLHFYFPWNEYIVD